MRRRGTFLETKPEEDISNTAGFPVNSHLCLQLRTSPLSLLGHQGPEPVGWGGAVLSLEIRLFSPSAAACHEGNPGHAPLLLCRASLPPPPIPTGDHRCSLGLSPPPPPGSIRKLTYRQELSSSPTPSHLGSLQLRGMFS